MDRGEMLRALAERVQTERPGDLHWKLNNEVWAALGWTFAGGGWKEPGTRGVHAYERPSLLHDLDEAVAQVEARGWWFLIGAGKTRPEEPLYGAEIYAAGDADAKTVIGDGEHPKHLASAVTAALLRALSAEADHG